jgi:hypothetical protein
VIDRITQQFFDSGKSFEEFLEEATEDEAKRFALYYKRSGEFFPPESLRIDTDYEINLVVAATTWCWDSQTNVPILVHMANNSPNINLRIFNKDNLPFLVSKINNGEKVPQVLVYTKDFYYLDRWVERSTKTYELYAEIRKKIGWEEETENKFIQEYRKSFLKIQKELGQSVIDEITVLLKRAAFISASTSRFAKK